MNKEKACLYITNEKQGTNNYPFTAGLEGDGFKNMLYSFVELRKELARVGIDLATRDINTVEDSQLLFCWDNPHSIAGKKTAGQMWVLLINDPPMYCPESWDPAWHNDFDYVLTFDETLVDNRKYFYYPFAIDTEYFSTPSVPDQQDFSRRRLATTISHAIHKYPDGNPGSTLHLRYETIKWYGANSPEDFRFYGGTFIPRYYYFGFRGVRYVRKLLPEPILRSLAAFFQKDLIRVYGGELKALEKFDVIKNFKFYYCYENTIGINGYVCEKIFDCFYTGVVPIYWGAPNIHELIPYKCFIDGNEFADQVALHGYISSMSYETWKGYIEEAIRFLNSESMKRFTVRSSVDYILSPIKDLIDPTSASVRSEVESV